MLDSIKRAKQVLKIEAEAVSNLIDKLDDQFDKAIDIILDSNGRVILTGMGKPGLIGRKISATFASTGTPSFFLHPAEAIHGDLGMITRQDIIIAISNSGQTEEIIKLVPLLKRIGCPIIALTGNVTSFLAKNSDAVLNVGVKQEACSLGLAPTASSTAELAMGDALAIVLLEQKGFKAEDYASLHPGGDLGRRLLIKVFDVMRKGNSNPVIYKNKKVGDALDIITNAKAGAITIIDDMDRVLGIFTDGDLRRLYLENRNIAEEKIESVMTKQPIFIKEDRLAVEALRIMQDKKIDELPVVNEDKILVGMLDIQDMLELGLL